ncbi:MAG: hypothetical protein IIA73_10045, partial [Proteobacteria bacterium]|nr:hypothetical protein [Pseudomonadota bacterium]
MLGETFADSLDAVEHPPGDPLGGAPLEGLQRARSVLVSTAAKGVVAAKLHERGAFLEQGNEMGLGFSHGRRSALASITDPAPIGCRSLSIQNGARTEIKGFQDLRSIPKVIENEVNRQLKDIKAGKKIKTSVRKAEP